MSRKQENNSLIANHPKTKYEFERLTDPKFQQGVLVQYEVRAQEANTNMRAMTGGMTPEQLVNSFLLTDETMDKQEIIHAFSLEKYYSETHNHYEPNRYGLSLMLTNKRMILIDLDRDDTPLLDIENSSSQNTLMTRNVGHEIKESVYYQPIPFSKIHSIVVDVSSTSSSVQKIEYLRNPLIAISIFLVGLFIGFLTESLELMGGGLLIGLISYYLIKQMKYHRPVIYSAQMRSLRIGLIDPETQKKALWIISVDVNYDPSYLVNWAATLQKRCENITDTSKSQTIIVP